MTARFHRQAVPRSVPVLPANLLIVPVWLMPQYHLLIIICYIAINDNVDTLNGDNELAPFLNILNEMHARQTSKKVKAIL